LLKGEEIKLYNLSNFNGIIPDKKVKEETHQQDYLKGEK